MIWAFNKPSNSNNLEIIEESLKNGVSRFGWGKYDLRKYTDSTVDEWQKESYKRANFMLNIKPNDWVVHINVPEWGKCTAAKVLAEYKHDSSTAEPFYNWQLMNTIAVDPETVVVFDRNDKNISPAISNRLKFQKHYQRIYYETEFFESIERIKSKNIVSDNVSKELFYLQKDFDGVLWDIAGKIQKNHPEKKLETFIQNIFQKFPNTVTKANGSGFGTDFGADLIVYFNDGHPIKKFQQEKTLVIQVKSYTGCMSNFEAVEQIKTAFARYDAHCGLIITTARVHEKVREAIEQLELEIGKPIEIMDGKDLATFVLKFGTDYIL